MFIYCQEFRKVKILKIKHKILDNRVKRKYYYINKNFGGELMNIKKKEELLKVNLKIFDELNDEDINYILGYVTGLVKARETLKNKN